ncbi:hypothetical protein [Roseateles chitinivorans]|uniref:hypothetical protein n=1 Tax=Roseateles chitinivorans TaxID=2917965 RepID=UPI003D66FDDF
MELERDLKQDIRFQQGFEQATAVFEGLAKEWRAIERGIAGLPDDDLSEADRGKLQLWQQVNIHLSEHEFAFSMAYEGGPEGLKRYLRGTANGHVKNFGVNDWRTALFRGLAVCDPFCNGGFVKALGIISSSEALAPPVAAI